MLSREGEFSKEYKQLLRLILESTCSSRKEHFDEVIGSHHCFSWIGRRIRSWKLGRSKVSDSVEIVSACLENMSSTHHIA